MASNIPTRRVTRTTRLATARDSENANARPSRIATRARPASNAAATNNNSAANGISRATAATAASRAKADAKLDPTAGKRKREALGEVTGLVTNNRTKGAENLVKGKDKEVKNTADVIPVKPKATTTTTRQPLKTVVGPTTRRTTRSTFVSLQQQKVEELKEEPPARDEALDENAMVVDDPVVLTRLRRTSKRKSGTSTHATVVEATIQSHSEIHRVSKQVVPPPAAAEDDAESNRVFKKRRTSSDAPEEVEVEQPQDESEAAAARIFSELTPYVYSEAEADPDGDQWEDLDEEDADDPLMVSEYVVDIFSYLKQIEHTTMPNPNYMENQKELAWKMRGILTDWLIQVHVRFHLLPETLFLCVNIIDRFLSTRVVSLAKLQLVGITSMFIASKFEEIVAPSAKHFLCCADASYTEADILQAERYVLKTLEWNLSYPNPVHYLRRISKADDYDVKVRTVAKYLLEIGCVEWRLIAAPPSLMAAASIWLARLVLGRETWAPNLAHYSTYAESALVPTANLMLNYILKPIRHESFYKKYAGKRFFKTSVYLRAWAFERWTENTQVSLANELPYLKAENRMAQDRANAAAVTTSGQQEAYGNVMERP